MTSKKIRDILELAKGKTVTGRRSALESFFKVYNNENILAEITRNSVNDTPDTVSWTDILHGVHNCVVMEGDRSTARGDIYRQKCSKLFFRTVTLSSNTLNTFDVISFVLQILSSETYFFCHTTYISVLSTYILPVAEHRNNVSREHWQELLKVFVNCYLDQSSPVKKDKILEAIKMIVHYGCPLSNLSIRVRKLMNFIAKVFEDMKSNDALIHSGLELANTVCREIAIESRLLLCQFGETIIPMCINLTKLDVKYKLFLILVQVHHPQGATLDDGIGYAVDVTTWKTILHQICNMIIQSSKTQALSQSCIDLGCEVFRQILEDPIVLEEIASNIDSQYTENSKRRRISNENGKMINMITGHTPERAWPMLQIFAKLFKKYPTSLKAKEFTLFLQIVSSLLMQSSSFPKIMDTLCELGIALVDVEHHLDSQETTGNNKLLWSEILDTVTSFLSTNHNQEAGHRFLQYSIENGKFMNLNSLLKTYVLKTMGWSLDSLRSLLVVCSNTTLPESLTDCNVNLSSAQNVMTPLETQLLQWVSNFPWKKLLTLESIQTVSELLIGLTLKSWQTVKKNLKENTETYNVDNLSEMEKCYLATKFCIDIYKGTTKANEDKINKEQLKQTCKKDNLNVLFSQLESILKTTMCKNDTTRILIIKCALIARIISDLKEMDAIQNDLHDFPLTPLLQNFLEKISQILADNDLTKFRHKDIIHIMKVLRILFQSTRNRSVNQIIINHTSVEALQKMYAFLQVAEGSDTHSRSEELRMDVDLDFGCNDKLMEQANKEAERNSVVKTLSLYCCATSEGAMIDIQEQLLHSLLDSDRYDLKSKKDMEVILMVLETVSNSDSSIHTEKSFEDIMNLLIEGFEFLYKDQSAARKILCWIPKFMKIAVRFDQNACHLVKIIGYFHNLLHDEKKNIKKSYGPSVYLDFLKCLEQLILLDPSFKFLKQNESTNEDTPVIEYLLEYINSPFYVVRLKVAHCVYRVFASKDISYEWKTSFFEKMKILLKNSFITNRKIDDNERADEMITRTTSMLYITSAVIYGSNLLKCQALFVLIHLAAQKGVEAKSVRKILQIVAREEETIVESNLDYLLMSWWDVQESFDKFPWDFTHCSTEEMFYTNYMHVLLPVLVKTGNLSQAVELCHQQGFKFERELERSFPTILAWILSKISENADPKAQNLLLKLEANEKEFRSVRRFTDLVHEKLDQIIVLLIKYLHEEKHFCELLGTNVIFPESEFVRISASVVDKCLLYMEINFFASGKLMHYLATERHDILQKILLKLTRNIYDKSSEHKLKAFHQYIYFCDVIAKRIKDFQFDEISTFLIRDICCTLLYQIDEDDHQLAEVSCKYFHTFLQMVLPEKSAVVKEIFIPCIKTLTRRVCKDETSSALHALQFLIVTQKDFFTEVISNLDFFPNKTVFEEMKKIHNSLRYNTRETRTLETEIEHFLNVSSDKNFSGTESLVRLRDQLSSRRKELKEHYKKLESLRGFAEDCASSKLHRLIRQLANLMGSTDSQVSQEAAKCLGLLGPGNLATMILLPDEINLRENSNRFEMLTHRILTLLSDLINEKNIEIREASADALYTVLSSYWGRNLMKRNYLKDFENAMDNKDLRLSVDHIRPFLTSSRINAPEDFVQLEICPGLQEEFWIENASALYSDWIKNFSCMIANCFRNFYIKSIIPILNLSEQFCEKILPWMVFAMFDNSKLSSETCKYISQFFHYHFAPSNDESSLSNKFAIRKSPVCTHKSVHSMLNIVNFIWIQSDRTVRLNLDYLSIAQGAQFCSAYFTSVLYAELWCDSFLAGNRDVGSSTIIDFIVERDPVRGKILQDIIREANVKIGDPDAIHGCGSTHLLDPASRIRHYVDLKQWDKAMLMQDIELSSGINSTSDMLHVLQQTGLYFLLNHFTSSLNDNETSKYNDYKFECAWRLGDWNLLESKQSTYSSQVNVNSLKYEKNDSYHFYHYEALKCINDNDKEGVKQAIENARNCVIKYLRNISLESCKAVYPMLSQLQMIREIEEWLTANPSEYGELISDWQYYEYIKNNDFEYIEPLLSQRIAICKMKQTHESDRIVNNALIDMHLDLVQYAEQRGHFRVATRTLDSLAKQNNLSQEVKSKLCYLEAHLAWKQNNQHIGQFLLNLLMNDSSANPSLRAQALCIFGNWVGETESGNPQVIIKKYYQESIDIFSSIDEPTSDDLMNLYATQAALARFSDMQYRQITEYIKSPQFKTLKSLAQLSGISTESVNSKDDDLRRAINIYQRQSRNDAAELENFQKDKNTYLLLALKFYLKTLEQSRDHDFLIFRVVSLWLDNMYHEDFNEILVKYLPRIASYKFVPLIPQLAPHMNLANDQFSSKINEIVKKCAIEHPHHTLPVLLALKNITGDSEFSNCQATTKEKPKPRVEAAKNLISQLLQTKIRPIIEEMSQLSISLVMLAYLEVPKKRPNEKLTIPSDQAINKIKNLNNIIIPTVTLSVRKNGNYDNIVGIKEYKSHFVTVGGVNAPKKIECIGTDGISRKQLVKGQDDMRQDAVMQQVFTVINSLLSANKETKERKLNIRTYKVVPLTQRSGVLEWCENTIPIATILLGPDRNSGLHKKYYPEDFTGLECRRKMDVVSKEANEIKLKAFLECCKNMHPAFHHFFTENYLSPEVWFERRLTYTRSVATTSIVGYILSVGDRHLQNILIDQTTAEVIHIDFGIAFEQGKLLSIPETVPFRLTRDIEVPMGVSGVEGVMRRCCEQTLKLLHEQREIIVTLLQVLLYDPLFTWSISSSKAHKIQSSTSSDTLNSSDGSLEINKFANRALLKVQQKLQGVEEGVTLSVEGQVERLIQQARDPSNLCLLFHGWQAYL